MNTFCFKQSFYFKGLDNNLSNEKGRILIGIATFMTF